MGTRRAAALWIGLLALAGLLIAGCDGEGIKISLPAESGDQTPTDPDGPDTPDPPDGPDDPVVPPVPAPRPFQATWVAAFGDDAIGQAAPAGPLEMAARLTLRQSGEELSGTGTLFRVFRQGPTATDQVDLVLDGTASGRDAVLLLSPRTAGAFEGDMEWRLRLAGNRMVGTYDVVNSAGSLVRRGHALWRNVASAEVSGSWVGAFSDATALGEVDPRDRAGAVALSRTDGDTLSGAGSFTEIRAGDLPLELDFDVVRGLVDGSRVGFSFGNVDLTNNEYDWFGFFNGNVITAAYAQFDADDLLVRYGHGDWYRTSVTTPDSVSHVWAGSFSDARTNQGVQPGSFLVALNLDGQNGGGITGTAQVLSEFDDDPVPRALTVENGNILGTAVQFELVDAARGQRWLWRLRIAGDILTGAYQRLTADDVFIAGGTAEFRYQSQPDLDGAWAAAFDDEFAAFAAPVTQLAVATIDRQAQGQLDGFGTLRLVGETSRRTFNLDGEVDGTLVTWIWRGQGFGDTVWHLRQAGNLLFGSFTNFTSTGSVEFRGSATFVRTDPDEG